jgi:phage N-6-adenine-methyltransferase
MAASILASKQTPQEFTLSINTEFKSLIPPLSSEEYAQLEKNIIADGCRDPLVVFNNTLVDGHNRYEICVKHDLPFIFLEKDFSSKDAAKLWMIDNQKGRRNLTDGWKFQLSQNKKDILLGMGRAKQKETLKQNTDTVLSIIDKTDEPAHNTQKVIAEDLGWSTGKVAMADKVWKEAAPEVKEKVLSGEVSINEAYKGLSAAETVAKSTAHVAHNSGENEWYTPSQFIEAARLAMGSIDLDPASCELANQTIKAGKFYTKEDNGLDKEWLDNIWLNPPYAQPLMNQFAEKLVSSLETINQAIVLVNNATETKWFQLMARQASAICFPESRIKFIDKHGNPSGAPLQGQTFLYFGGNTKGFHEHFNQFGFVMVHV